MNDVRVLVPGPVTPAMRARRTGRLLAGVITFGIALAACGSGIAAPGSAGTPAGSGAGTGSGHLGSKVSPARGAAGAATGDITLAFAGDVHFTGRTAVLLKNPATAFGPIAPLLRSADFTVLNLETAITSRGVPQPKTYHFRTTPVAFTALRAAGIDLVTMANNHVLDYGQLGLTDTLAAIKKSGFPVVGVGKNAAAAWAPYVVTIKGVKIAFVGVSQVGELASTWVATATRAGEANTIDLSRTLAAVRAARKLASVVVVFMHWGTEGSSCPDPNQAGLAPKLVAAGATIIIGSHAHMLQGSGWLGHTFVAYGMANFLWYGASWSTATGVLLLTLHPAGPLTSRFVPATVSGTGQPVVATGAAAKQALTHYQGLRACTGLTAKPGP